MAAARASGLVSKPSLIEFKGARFLITDAPTDNNIGMYIQEFKKHGVVTVVRTCDPTYSPKPIKDGGIDHIELPFPDGAPPPDAIVDEFMKIVMEVLSNSSSSSPGIAIHCVAGLGRAPVLVAVALIELGMDRFRAVELIREKRPKAFNLKQINYLETYKRKSKKHCLVM